MSTCTLVNKTSINSTKLGTSAERMIQPWPDQPYQFQCLHYNITKDNSKSGSFVLNPLLIMMACKLSQGNTNSAQYIIHSCMLQVSEWNFDPTFLEMLLMMALSTIDREIFAVKIICVLNFPVKNISLPDGSAM